MSTKKELFLFGAIAVLSLVFMLNADKMTGNAAQAMCPDGYFWRDSYCIQEECRHVQCETVNNFMKVPDCVCMPYYGKWMCGLKGNAKTGVKTNICTRSGQLDKVCGTYNSTTGFCVVNQTQI